LEHLKQEKELKEKEKIHKQEKSLLSQLVLLQLSNQEKP
jgi:hypothetical protein